MYLVSIALYTKHYYYLFNYVAEESLDSLPRSPNSRENDTEKMVEVIDK